MVIDRLFYDTICFFEIGRMLVLLTSGYYCSKEILDTLETEEDLIALTTTETPTNRNDTNQTTPEDPIFRQHWEYKLLMSAFARSTDPWL
jgi:hypothetical protein